MKGKVNMSAVSLIEWTQESWNPVTGCTKISEGCENCYAAKMAHRLQTMGNPKYSNGFAVTTHEYTLKIPFKWKKPRMVFVNSMSDLFHEDVSVDFIKQVFQIMTSADQHVFQVLTKRPERLVNISDQLEWSPNIWIGVTVESDRHFGRIDLLREVNASLRFICFEPLLSDVSEVDLSNIRWVIVGGESGPGARPIQKEWVTSIRNICVNMGIPFFFKQWGGRNKKAAGRYLEGRKWDQMPETDSSGLFFGMQV